MADQTTRTTDQTHQTIRQRITAALPTGLALALIGLVWMAGAVWSFEEQTAFARSRGFQTPQLLPLVLDGMAVAMAAVAYAASLDARPAVFARGVTGLAIAASAASNGAWAWARSGGDTQTVILAAGVPVVAAVAFEVLLAEVRRQVLRRRGQPGPVAVTWPRPIRLALAPWSTMRVWRALVLEVTDPRRTMPATPQAETGPDQTTPPDHPRQTAPDPQPALPPVEQTPAQAAATMPARQTQRRVRPQVPVSPIWSADRDRADLARLRAWQTTNDGQTPSITQTQAVVGGGRSRAIRLRGLLAADQTDTDQAAA